MASAPAFAATPRISAASVSTTNTNRDGTGTIATVFTAGSSGSQIRQVDLKATGTTVAANVVLYLHDGTNYWVDTEVAVTAITAAATTQSYAGSVRFDNLYLPSGWSLRASITAAPTSGNVAVIALGADL
jgi:hypothetical protein